MDVKREVIRRARPLCFRFASGGFSAQRRSGSRFLAEGLDTERGTAPSRLSLAGHGEKGSL